MTENDLIPILELRRIYNEFGLMLAEAHNRFEPNLRDLPPEQAYLAVARGVGIYLGGFLMSQKLNQETKAHVLAVMLETITITVDDVEKWSATHREANTH